MQPSVEASDLDHQTSGSQLTKVHQNHLTKFFETGKKRKTNRFASVDWERCPRTRISNIHCSWTTNHSKKQGTTFVRLWIHILATVNNASRNTGAQILVHVLTLVLWRIYREVEHLGQMGVLCLMFWGTAQCFPPTVSCGIPRMHGGCAFPTIHQHSFFLTSFFKIGFLGT